MSDDTSEAIDAATEIAKAEEMARMLGYGSMTPDPKQNVHTFLHNVVTAADTTKLGNLNEEEIGMSLNSVRAFNHAADFAEFIMENEALAKYLRKASQNVTAPSLSRSGFLVRQATLQRREMADVTKVGKTNSSWFKKKDKPENPEN